MYELKLVNTSGTKRKEYRKAKIHEFETNSKTKNIRDLYMGISDFKKGYQSRTNIVKGWEGWFGYRVPQYSG